MSQDPKDLELKAASTVLTAADLPAAGCPATTTAEILKKKKDSSYHIRTHMCESVFVPDIKRQVPFTHHPQSMLHSQPVQVIQVT